MDRTGDNIIALPAGRLSAHFPAPSQAGTSEQRPSTSGSVTTDDDSAAEAFAVSASSLHKWPSAPQKLGEVKAGLVIGYIANVLLLMASSLFIGQKSSATFFRCSLMKWNPANYYVPLSMTQFWASHSGRSITNEWRARNLVNVWKRQQSL